MLHERDHLREGGGRKLLKNEQMNLSHYVITKIRKEESPLLFFFFFLSRAFMVRLS